MGGGAPDEARGGARGRLRRRRRDARRGRVAEGPRGDLVHVVEIRLHGHVGGGLLGHGGRMVPAMLGRLRRAMATATSTEPRLATPPAGSGMRRHLNLTRELAVTQFKLKYTGSVLGYLWSLLKPMMTFGIMWAVFERLLHAGRTSDRFTMQLLVGIVIWTFFAETTITAVNAIVVNGNLINKASFPRAILVVASSLTALMTFAINLTLIVLIAGASHQLTLGWHSLAAIPLLIELYVLVIGISMLLSALFVFYRDLGHIWEIFTQLLFYGSAVRSARAHPDHAGDRAQPRGPDHRGHPPRAGDRGPEGALDLDPPRRAHRLPPGGDRDRGGGRPRRLPAPRAAILREPLKPLRHSARPM
ncbi:MAG: ABC transporter permease [Chloroflexi bacterium]|nr:MAG: ABC transporter permease [Chloroflexota bacterium]